MFKLIKEVKMFITAPIAQAQSQVHEINVKIDGYIQKFSIQDIGDVLNIFIGEMLENSQPNFVYIKSSSGITDDTSANAYYMSQVVNAYLTR